MATTVRIDILADNSVAIRTFDQTARAGDKMGKALTGLAISDVGDRMAQNVTAPIIGGLAAATNEAIKYETAQTDISKALDLSEAAAGQMADQFLRAAPALGLLPQEMAALATEGGKMGVAAGEVDEFAEAIAKVSVALDLSAEESAKAMGKISAAFGLPAKDINQLAADVNALDDRIGGVASEIIDATQRAAAMSRMFGVTASEIAAFAATMNKQGISAERIGTSLNKMFDVLNTIRYGTPAARDALSTLGYTVEQFEAAVGQKGAARATQELLNRIAQVPDKAVRGKVLMDIFGRTAADEIGTLVTNFGTLGTALDLAANKQGNLNKFNQEFEKRSNTTAFQIKEFQGNLSALGITIGRIVLPPLNQILKVVSPIVQGLASFATANPAIATVVVGLLALAAAIAPILIVVGSVMTAMATIAPLLGVVGGAIGAISLPVVGVIAIFAALGVAIAYLIANWEQFASDWSEGANAIAYSIGYVLGGAFNWFKGMATAALNGVAIAWDVVKGATSAFVSFITPALQVAALPYVYLATVVLWAVNQIMQTWGLISPYIQSGVNFVTAQLQRFGNFVGSIVGYISGQFSRLSNYVGSILAGIGNTIARWAGYAVSAATTAAANIYNGIQSRLQPVYSFFTNLFNWIGNALNQFASWAYNAGAQIITMLIQGINSQFQNAIASFNNQLQQLRSYLPSSDARRGALSDISTTGSAMMETIASGISAAPVANALNRALGSAKTELAPAPTSGGGGGRGGVIINYQPTITMGQNGNIVDELRRHARELLDLIQETEDRANRAKF